MAKFTFYVVFNTVWTGLSFRRLPKGVRLNLGFVQIVFAAVDIEIELGRAWLDRMTMARQVEAAHIALHQSGYSPANDGSVWARQNAPSTLTRH